MKLFWLFVFVFVFAFWGAASAASRVALVIGNGQYANLPLNNPVNDAADISDKLQKLGFEVTLLLDADQRTMEGQISRFRDSIQDAGIRLFYYAGHGIQVRGENYLVPVDMDAKAEEDVKYEAVDAGRVLDAMASAGEGVNIIILDACRNNPFAAQFRSGNRGLARMPEFEGSVIVYATSPGNVAADGNGRNGLFTQYLLTYIDSPDLTLEQVFKRTGKAVSQATAGQQRPWMSIGVYDDIYLAGRAANSGASARPSSGSLHVVPVTTLDRGNPTDYHLWRARVHPQRAHAQLQRSGKILVSFAPLCDLARENDIRNGFSGMIDFIPKQLKEIVEARKRIAVFFAPEDLAPLGPYVYEMQAGTFDIVWHNGVPDKESAREMAREMKSRYLFFIKCDSDWQKLLISVWMYDAVTDTLEVKKRKADVTISYKAQVGRMLERILNSFFDGIISREVAQAEVPRLSSRTSASFFPS